MGEIIKKMKMKVRAERLLFLWKKIVTKNKWEEGTGEWNRKKQTRNSSLLSPRYG